VRPHNESFALHSAGMDVRRPLDVLECIARIDHPRERFAQPRVHNGTASLRGRLRGRLPAV